MVRNRSREPSHTLQYIAGTYPKFPAFASGYPLRRSDLVGNGHHSFSIGDVEIILAPHGGHLRQIQWSGT